jgi:hypothetical protein
MRLKWSRSSISTDSGCRLRRDAVAGAGQRVAQGGLDGRAVEQGVAQRVEQAGDQAFQLAQLGLVEGAAAAEGQLAQVFPGMVEVVGGAVAGRFAELQAQVGAAVLVAQVVQRQQRLDLLEEQAQDAFDLEAGLQLHGELPAHVRQAGRAPAARAAALDLAQALELGGIEIDGVGLLGRGHDAWRPLAQNGDSEG